MKGYNRRRFMQLASAGSIVAATAGAAVAVPLLAHAPRLSATSKQGSYTFRAVAAMPAKPLPGYASFVLEGHIDLTARTGTMTKTIFAGAPEAMSTVALPGLSRIFRITSVQNRGGIFRVQGVVDDRSQLQAGESRNVDLLIDPASGIARLSHFGTNIVLNLEG